MTLISTSEREHHQEQDPALDPETLRGLWELADGDDTSFLEELFQSFIQSCDAIAERMHSAMEQGQNDEVGRQAHSLKGASSNVGALPLARLCLDVETLCQEGDLEQAVTRFSAIQSEIERVRSAILERLQEWAGD